VIRLLVTCEHASPEIPASFQNLGVGAEALRSHSSYDEGAAPVAKDVAAAFGVFPYLGQWSRLLADLNRSPENPYAVPEVSFGLYVPGNYRLSSRERAERLRRYHRPYRETVRAAANAIVGVGDVCLHLAVHSFTDEIDGTRRDGEAGVLYDLDHPLEARLAEPMLAAMRETLDTRPNYPYPGTADALCTTLRGELPPELYAGIEIELSHKLLRTTEGVNHSIAAVERALREVLRPLTSPLPRA
jgi:predicted N-formylglutamate amidohydrolase